MMESVPVGKSPYTYSDFTGFGLQTVVRPDGFFRSVVEGCLDNMNKTRWRALTWNEVEPMGTSVKLRVRFADTLAGLETAAWFGPFDAPQPPVNLMALGVPSTRFAQVEVQLSSTVPGKSPSFSGYQLTFEGCGTAIGSLGDGIFDRAPGTATHTTHSTQATVCQPSLWAISNSSEAVQENSTTGYLERWFAPQALSELLTYCELIDTYEDKDILKVILSRSARSARMR